MRFRNQNRRKMGGDYHRCSGIGFIAILLVMSALLACGEKPVRRDVPQRIISLSPNLTEVLFAVGAGDRVVGVTEFCTYPPEAQDKTSVGGLLNPNYEAMFALEPDLVVMLPSHEQVRDQLEAAGIECMVLENDRIEDLLASISALGKRIGAADGAEALRGSIAGRLDSLRRFAGEREALPVLIVVGRSPGEVRRITAAGPGTFLDEVAGYAGGENVFGDAPIRYPDVSVEEVLRRAPSVIIELRPGAALSPADEARLREDWRRLRLIPAVRDDLIFFVTDDYALIPGPRMVKLAEQLAKMLDEVRKARGAGR